MVACCWTVGSSAGGTGRAQQIGRSRLRGRRSRLVPHTPALHDQISLGLHSPIPKEGKKKGVSLPS